MQMSLFPDFPLANISHFRKKWPTEHALDMQRAPFKRGIGQFYPSCLPNLANSCPNWQDKRIASPFFSREAQLKSMLLKVSHA